MGVMTMKMINNTSITSTIGVTLMSATGGGTGCFFMVNLLLYRKEQQARRPATPIRIQLAAVIVLPSYFFAIRWDRFRK
jgi:hypothetical protein